MNRIFTHYNIAGTKPEEKSWGCTLPKFCDQKEKKGPHFFWFKKASVSFIFFDFHVFFAEYLGAKGNKTPDLVGGKVKIVWERGGQQFLWGCTFLIWGCTILIWGCTAPLCTPWLRAWNISKYQHSWWDQACIGRLELHEHRFSHQRQSIQWDQVT